MPTRLMTPTEFRTALASLGYSQRGFAAYIYINERTVRRWALGKAEVPKHIELLLHYMLAWKAKKQRPSGSSPQASLPAPQPAPTITNYASDAPLPSNCPLATQRGNEQTRKASQPRD